MINFRPVLLSSLLLLFPIMATSNCPDEKQLREVFSKAITLKDKCGQNKEQPACVGFDLDNTWAKGKNVFYLSGSYDLVAEEHGDRKPLKGVLGLETNTLEDLHHHMLLGPLLNDIQKSLADTSSKIVLEKSHDDNGDNDPDACIYKVAIPLGGDIGTQYFELKVYPKQP